jgi:hypothetical protein
MQSPGLIVGVPGGAAPARQRTAKDTLDNLSHWPSYARYATQCLHGFAFRLGISLARNNVSPAAASR